MVYALEEIQSKGDLTMRKIREKKQLLTELRMQEEEVIAELEKEIRITEEIERTRRMIEEKNDFDENHTRLIQGQKGALEEEINLMDETKKITNENLNRIKSEVDRVRKETNDKDEELAR